MAIIINNYSVPVYILFDYSEMIENFKFDEKKLKHVGIVCILTSWYKTCNVSKIANSNSNYNIVILSNSLEEKSYFENMVKCDVIFCNHNAFLNETKYKIMNSIGRNYDLIIDSAFHEYKNVKIAKKIKNTIHIGYFKTNRLDVVIPDYGVVTNFKNGHYRRLDKNEINLLYNQSLIGGIFSELEGACFASSQYLLAGMPVISIKSLGGRDIWYNENNSIICENDEDAVYHSLEVAKQKILTGEFDREKIRNLHLKQMDEHRNTLIEYLNNKLLQVNENVDVGDIKKQFAFF